MTKPESRLMAGNKPGGRTARQPVPAESVAAPQFLWPDSVWARSAVTPFLQGYSGLNARIAQRGRWGLRLAESHGLFFAGAVLLAVLLAPRFLMLGYYLVAKLITGGAATKPDTSVVPFTPDAVAVILGVFILTFAMPRKWRLMTALVVSLYWPLVQFGINAVGFAVFAGYVATLYAIAKIRISRYAVFALAVALVTASLAVMYRSAAVADSGILRFLSRLPMVVPMIWYSMIEEMPPRRQLRLTRHAIYHYLRLLYSPVLTFKDVFGPTGTSLAHIRVEGFKALYTVLVAVFVVDAIGKYLDRVDGLQLTGLPLLGYSYLYYVRTYCLFVIGINAIIAALRLMGLPVRNNFNWWLLARTPNEHWRRWNMLMREWIVGFVFFPIMRSRRWLFLAVMASLGVSGILHVVPGLLRGGADWWYGSIVMAYWVLNGLAIYVFIKIPQLIPDLVDRLRIRTSRLWWVAGIVSTSAFYGVLVHVRESCRTWDQVGFYFERLLGG